MSTSRASCCEECESPLAHDQRYCVECGERRGPLAHAIAARIGVAPQRGLGQPGDTENESGATDAEGSDSADPSARAPSPPVIAVAVMAVLAFGVLVGSAASPIQNTAAVAPIVVAVSPAATVANPSLSASAAPPPPATPEATPAPAEPATTIPSTKPPSSKPTGKQKNSQPAGGSTTGALPPITHVFEIVLSDQGFNAAFGPGSHATYLAKTLTGQGELLDNYYAATGGELANEIALISGQGPTPQTATNCPLYTGITPGTVGAEGQALGAGCVYPQQVLTIGDQLAAAHKTWKAYVEAIGSGGPGQPTTCRHPALPGADADQTATPADPYVTWRDPFVYFQSVIGDPGCANSVVGLNQLTPDLKTTSATPSLSYIVPDRCHDGTEEPCAPGQASGLAGADGFLASVVPQIESSPAYKTGGLIVITFDQAPQSGPGADPSGCCMTSAFPNLPTGSTGATGASGTTTMGATTATGSTTTTTTGAPGTATTTEPATGTPAGGGRVGLLLISKYVKPASVNVTGEYDHFSLLASIENLFGLSHLGYAGAEGLLVFDTSVYNARP